MTYEEIIELEENIQLKNKANEIYEKFCKNIKLEVSKYKGDGRFLHWSDSHNSTYFTVQGDKIYYECRFLHESYDVECTPNGIFSGLKREYRGIDHLESAVRGK